MSLAVDVSHRFGAFLLEARFVSAGRLTAFFGRSGSGKTSLVNIIAGVVRPDRGRIVLDDTPLVDTQRGLFVPKYRRRVGYVFQEGRLFPHLTVRQNLLFGQWFTPARERHVSLDQVVDLLDIGPLLDRRPGGLSGGEKQRVAIGRALLTSPRLLLMDEPLASSARTTPDSTFSALRPSGRVVAIITSRARMRIRTAVPIGRSRCGAWNIPARDCSAVRSKTRSCPHTVASIRTPASAATCGASTSARPSTSVGDPVATMRPS